MATEVMDLDEEDNIPTQIIKSVVKIFATHCGPYYAQPWEMMTSSSSTSSGFVISTKDREIMCNAHGVVNATSIRVRKYGESKKYNAKIIYIGHDCDLAILQVDNNKFWNNKPSKNNNNEPSSPLQPIEFVNSNTCVNLRDTITVLGYPKGFLYSLLLTPFYNHSPHTICTQSNYNKQAEMI